MNRLESTTVHCRVLSLLWGIRFVMAFVGVVTGVSAAVGGDDDAAVAGADVRAGIAAFESGDYEAAIQSFERALELAPENQRIMFDLGCAVRAAGDLPRAEQLLKQAAQSPDLSLAASAHFNLGGIKAEGARAIFGEPTVDAPPEARERGEAVLLQAVAHYRAALELNRDHEAARKNLELVRLWLKNMHALWRQRDLESRSAQPPLEQLERLLAENRDRRRELRRQLDQPAGMARHASLMQVAADQKLWQQQLETVREALETELQDIDPSQRGPLLDALAEAGSDSNAAVRLIKRKDLESAIQALQRADTSARDVYRLLAGLPQQVQFAINQQTATLEFTESLETLNSSDNPRQHGPTLDTRFEQSGIGRILDAIRQRAPVELEMLNANSPRLPEDAVDGAVDPQQAAAIQQYRELLERAIQLGSELPEWSDQAETHLAEHDWAEAIDREQSILQRLREILESPDEQQNQNQNSNQSGDPQPDEEDQKDDRSENSPDKNSGDENPQQPDHSGTQQPTQTDGEPKSESQQPEDMNKPADKEDVGDTGKDQDTQQPRRDSEETDQPPDTRPTDESSSDSQADPAKARESLSGLTEEQVESLLQKVRERERYRRELEKQVQRLIQSTQRARKDW